MEIKTIKIKDKTHHDLSVYKVENRLKTLDDAITKLLKDKKK